jgi:integrase
MTLKVKELQAAKPGEWLSDGPAGSGRGSGVLLFRRTSAGATLAYFRYTLPDGTRDTLPIGQYDEGGRDGMTLGEAREKAGELSRLYQSGMRNIRTHIEATRRAADAAGRAEKATQEAAEREAEDRRRHTLQALCEAYTGALERAGKAKSAAATRSAFKCHVLEAHPDIAALPAREVTAHQVAAMVRKVREAGKERAAGILRSYLSAAFNAAKRAPFDSALPAGLIAFGIEHNPCDAIPAIPVQAGDRTLSAAELRAYVGLLLRVGQADALGLELPDAALLVALLAGGQRMAQLLRAKAGDYDADTATLRLWDGKGKRQRPREHLLPLAPKAAALVAALVERATHRERERAKAEGRAPDMASLWLFSTHGRVPMTETTPGKRVAEISASMGGEPFDLRDIRRTVETMLAGMGISKDTRAQLLSHGISGVQAAHYDRHAYTGEKRAALVAWEARLDAIRNAERTPFNVVQMRAA